MTWEAPGKPSFRPQLNAQPLSCAGRCDRLARLFAVHTDEATDRCAVAVFTETGQEPVTVQLVRDVIDRMADREAAERSKPRRYCSPCEAGSRRSRPRGGRPCARWRDFRTSLKQNRCTLVILSQVTRRARCFAAISHCSQGTARQQVNAPGTQSMAQPGRRLD